MYVDLRALYPEPSADEKAREGNEGKIDRRFKKGKKRKNW